MDRFVGLEIRESASGLDFRLAHIQYQRDGLVLTDQSDSTEWEFVQSYLERYPHIPLLLTLSGSMVMEKVIPYSERGIFAAMGISQQQERDFHVQNLFSGEPYVVGALVRAAYLADMLAQLGPHSKRIISLNLSPAISLHLLPQLGNQQEGSQYVNLDDKTYYLQTGKPVVPRDPNSFEAFDLIGAAHTAGIAAADIDLAAHALARLYLPDQLTDSALLTSQEALHTRQNRWIKSLGVGTILVGVFLVITLLTQLGYQYSLGSLEKRYQSSQGILDQIRANRSVISDREATVNRLVSSTLKSSRIAWILDQIALQRPDGITFSTTTYQPDIATLQQLDAADRVNVDLLIRGKAQQSSEISTYSLQLESLPFISTVEIYRSAYLFREEQFEFVLFIHLNPPT